MLALSGKACKTDLANEGEDAKGGHLDKRDAASAHAPCKLGGVAGLGRLSQEGGQATDEAAAQHDGAAQDLHLAQDLVHLMQRLHQTTTSGEA